MTPQPFDLQRVPLSGSNLLEAGAGTGKTFSLTYLYLRLLLEEGLRVEEILVTTFTIAATAELKGRIFDTIALAERTFDTLCDSSHTAGKDDVLQNMLQMIRQQTNDDMLLRQRLRLALAQFDYAQIFTINGFALHVLREYADVLDCYVPEQILNDDSEFVKTAYLELARDNFTNLGEQSTAIGAAVADFTSQALVDLLTQMLNYRDYVANSQAKLLHTAQTIQTLIEQAINADHSAVSAILLAAIDDKQLKRNTYKANKITENVTKLKEASAYHDKTFIAFFSREKLQKNRTKHATIEFNHPLFVLFDTLVTYADDLAVFAYHDKYHALLVLSDALHERVEALKAEAMALTHDDIVRRVANGAHRIQTSLKAALIDEAQDTNTAQMQLFRHLFLHNPHTITFFVGDPKQAIYGFRGANIFSYLGIQNEVTQHYVMDTNYRSSEALNASINAFFSGNNPFNTSDITYYPIGWRVDNDNSAFGDKSLTLVTASPGDTTTLANTAADAIIATLQEKSLTPEDIAVLTRTSGQAKLIKQALAQRGLSASFTGKLSLYDSDEAKLLLALLQAIHRGEARWVKSLMLTPLFGQSLADVHNLETVNQLRAELQGFAAVYQQYGFSVMFYRLMKRFAIAGRLLQTVDGNRRLTNFIQLFERLQQTRQTQSLSLAGLCDRLSQHIHDADSEAELRLEDDHAISIMTIHTAKGLEFPVVCLPFFDYHRGRHASPSDLLVSHQQHSAAPAFLQPSNLIQQVNKEAAEENRRLAYVALTRAKYHNLIICQPVDSQRHQKGAMLPELLATLTDSTLVTQGAFVDQAPDALDTSVDVVKPSVPSFTPKRLRQPLYSGWQLDSFSRLQQYASEHSAVTLPVKPEHGTLIDGALMHYPSGPRPGTALHEMYEHFLAHRQNDSAFHQAIEQSIDRHLLPEDKRNRPDTPSLAGAVAKTTTIALMPKAFCLQQIDIKQQSIEMKFFLHLSPAARQRLLTYFGLSQQDETLIPVDGYIHGYIDYCFEYDGKFYVLDYKSNRLGDTLEDYSHANMYAEMQHHRYDLQALIYTLALCKHLRIKTQTEYEITIGGYYYLFVRGMVAGRDTGIYANNVEWALIEALL